MVQGPRLLLPVQPAASSPALMLLSVRTLYISRTRMGACLYGVARKKQPR